MRSAYDISFNILSSIGATTRAQMAIFQRLEYEDLRPFMAKLTSLASYIRENRHIKDVDNYIISSMNVWFSDWLERYDRIDQDDLSAL